MTLTNPLSCRRNDFSLPPDTHYLNCATRAPFSKAVEQAGYEAVRRHTDPFGLRPADFFSGAVTVRELFARLINQPDPDRIAVIPAVSYGMGIVARNLHRKPGLRPGQRIVLIDDEFPSDVFAWKRVAEELRLEIAFVPKPTGFPQTADWNTRLLEAIGPDTALVLCPPVHWMYGNRFDLEAVGRRAREVGALFVIDGTQAVGALPFDWRSIRPDALVCAAYKWLMGPYTLGLACFGGFFDEGIPLEESWMNRIDSQEFHRLTDYQPTYRPKAARYNMGEHSHFIQMPMLEQALRQLLAWQPERIQEYGRRLLADALPALEALGCRIEPEGSPEQPGRGHHLVGVWLPERVGTREVQPQAVQQALLAGRVSVSARGRVLRVAPHVYNDERDVAAFLNAIRLELHG
ncbi:aminotransferase class V-fold PLP-dependent enzyme [Larkinella soli]|uniref:aminotransferase class V-fold PLP-dependent enzyme n=1 Tax=Larkinella soli TaxID=1770527 RepID=UPI000FFC2204|nr:aminotransferase class V-fold PLP-dependent enzyme [Larkinella soli]